MLNEINNLDTSNSTWFRDILSRKIKDNAKILIKYISQNFGQWIIDGKYPDQWIKQTLVLSLEKKTI